MPDYKEREFGDLTVRINRDACIASSNCMKLAPGVFEFDDSSICTFKENPEQIDREELIEACRVCPADALIVIDEEENQIVP